MYIRLLPLFAFLFLLNPLTQAASDKQLDNFSNKDLYYVAANPSASSGTISKSITTAQFKEGNSSLQIDYSLNAASGNYVEVFRSYGTSTLDLSFMPDYLSLWVKGQTENNDIFKFMLYEDKDMDGNPFEAGDDIYVYTNNSTLNTDGWALLTMSYGDFVKFGGGTGTIDLNRIGAWRIIIENGNGTAHSGTVFIDDLRQYTTYTPVSTGTPTLNGSFIQLWNNAGCSCGQWTQSEWNNQMQKMKDVCMDKLIVQYSVYGDNAWYTPSSLSYVVYKNETLARIFQAAQTKGIKVYLGLYFDETWNSFIKSEASYYISLLQKQKDVINELYTLFGTNAALEGWYIPQEINDLEWQTTSNAILLADYFQDVAYYAKQKDASKKVMIAPFFGPHRPADNLELWYNQFLSTAVDIDIVYPQDGVGTATKDVDVDIPHYFNAIKNACNSTGRVFGATVENFLLSAPTSITSLKTQLQENGKFTNELITFEWGYMQPGLSAATQKLYDDYKAYANCITTSLINSNESRNINSFPVPAVAGKSITLQAREFEGECTVSIVNSMGVEICSMNYMDVTNAEVNLPEKLSSGTYLLLIKNKDKIATKRIIVQ